MLHLAFLMLLLPPDLQDLAQKERLLQQIQSQTIQLRGRKIAQPGVWQQRPEYRLGGGWYAGAGRILTSYSFALGLEALEARQGEHWLSIKQLRADPQAGTLWFQIPLQGPSSAPHWEALNPGGTLYASWQGRLFRFQVGRRAEGSLAFYHWVLGAILPLGCPLFASDGQVRSLVAISPLRHPGGVLALPVEAFEREEERP